MAQLSAVRDSAEYPFWLYLPEDSILEAHAPVLIFLHGRSLSGTDLKSVKRYGVITEIEKGRNIGALVVAPQVPKGQAWSPDKIISVLDYVQQKYQTDSNRVYVCGMSLGGYGTLNLVGKYPDRVAAAIAMCGGGDVNNACNMAKVPLWIRHGAKDKAVPISESEKVVQAIRECDGGKLLSYTRLEDANHGDLAKFFRMDTMYEWLFKHHKEQP
ncbi:MAG: phospholipase [Bacteroidetes bacterium]|nr:MAG: phospholipase [Bacteroidota bacterium]